MTPRTDAGRAGLAALRADPAHAVLALDYDGTLAPVVARPEDAVPAGGAAAALRALAPRVGRVALVTGRPADVALDLSGLADLPGLVVLGQYGLQRWQAGVLSAPPPPPSLEVLRARLPDLLAREPGATLEDKGQSLVVHVRGADDPVGAQDRLAGPLQSLAGQTGLELHPGRRVLELRRPGYDKRAAVLSLAEPAPSALLFAGDDLGDLPGFDAVEELRGRGVPGLTVCSASDEGPPVLRERADVVVDGPDGLVALLQGLLP